ncbi:MAG: AAA family ATPase [Anaerolineales bacterium]|nr:AAA family ATPase [Anaerolineales bacterium]
MKLIIIYGAEATGKLTIAKKLAEETGFKLFHNHVSADLAKVFFDFGMDEFDKLVWDVRILALEHAARANIPGVIFIWAYSHPDFLPYLKRLWVLCEKENIEISYVHVSCAMDELKKRVLKSDRKGFGKINTIEGLERLLAKKNHQVIPDTDSLVIDNTNISPQDAAELILEHIKIGN